MMTKSLKCAVQFGAPVFIALVAFAPFAAHAASLPTAHLVAAVDVNVYLGAPPPPRHEVIIERDRPSRDHVWVGGYWASRHGRHEWIPGHWELPPRGRNVWVAPRWEKHDRGYVFVEGYWADPHHDHRDHH